MDLVDHCTREKPNTKWRPYKFTFVTVFASLLKGINMGCKNTVMPEPFGKNHSVDSLTFEGNTRQPHNENMWLFQTFVLQLHCNDKLEEATSKLFNLFLPNWGEGDATNFQSIPMNDIPKIGDMLQLNFFSIWNWFRWEGSRWWISLLKYSKVWKECQVLALQQSHLLRQQHQRTLQSFPMQYLWDVLFKDWYTRMTFRYLQWTRQTHLP